MTLLSDVETWSVTIIRRSNLVVSGIMGCCGAANDAIIECCGLVGGAIMGCYSQLPLSDIAVWKITQLWAEQSGWGSYYGMLQSSWCGYYGMLQSCWGDYYGMLRSGW